jgi:hypothetical protein
VTEEGYLLGDTEINQHQLAIPMTAHNILWLERLSLKKCKENGGERLQVGED